MLQGVKKSYKPKPSFWSNFDETWWDYALVVSDTPIRFWGMWHNFQGQGSVIFIMDKDINYKFGMRTVPSTVNILIHAPVLINAPPLVMVNWCCTENFLLNTTTPLLHNIYFIKIYLPRVISVTHDTEGFNRHGQTFQKVKAWLYHHQLLRYPAVQVAAQNRICLHAEG